MLRLKLKVVMPVTTDAVLVLNDWLSAYQDTLICEVFLSLEATFHMLYI